jgi:hypothetical protein
MKLCVLMICITVLLVNVMKYSTRRMEMEVQMAIAEAIAHAKRPTLEIRPAERQEL